MIISNWNHVKVAEWFNKIGLGDCSNIIKYKQINGQTILNADSDYYYDTLGISFLTEQNKFEMKLN